MLWLGMVASRKTPPACRTRGDVARLLSDARVKAPHNHSARAPPQSCRSQRTNGYKGAAGPAGQPYAGSAMLSRKPHPHQSTQCTKATTCTAPSGCTTCGSTPVPALPAIQASCTHRPCISCSGTKSSATVVYDTSPLSACMRAALQMSRLPISASRPPLPSTLSDAANMPADVRELSTSPTPEPCLVRVAHSWAKAVSRELTLACACRALACMRFLELPAVANTGTPSSASMDTAVSPTPPAAACTSTGVLVHRWWLAWWSMMWTVMDTVGMEAAWLWHREAGLTATRWGSTVQRVPRQPGARPKALSPTWSTSDPTMPALEATITPEQSPPGGPGSPGYIPRMLRTSRKLMPTA
eukprot:7068636-Pyramimonas_sp.AAC.1